MRWPVLAMALLMLPGFGRAEESAGEFVSEGVVEFMPRMAVTGEPSLVVLDDSTGLRLLVVKAPVVRLRYVEVLRAKVEWSSGGGYGGYSQIIDRDERVMTYENAQIETDGVAGPGRLVVDAVWGRGRLETQDHRATLRSSDRTADHFGSHIEHPSDMMRHQARPEPHHEVMGPHLVVAGPGEVDFHGGAVATIWGPRVVVRTPNGTHDYPTGVASGGLGREWVRWIVLDFQEGDLRARSDSQWRVAAPDLAVDWAGEASFHPVSGRLRTADRTFEPSSAGGRLTGRFAAVASPVDLDGQLLVRLAMEGEFVGTTLRAVPAASPPEEGPPWFVPLVVGSVLAALGAGGSFLLLRARRRSESAVAYTAEDCVVAVDRAMAQGEWNRAAQWLERACALAPTSASLRADLAYAMMQMGQPHEAVKAYRQAESQGPLDGESYLHAAVAAVRAGSPVHEVEGWLEKALSARPGLVVDLEDVDDLGPLLDSPEVTRMMDVAWVRFSEEGI